MTKRTVNFTAKEDAALDVVFDTLFNNKLYTPKVKRAVLSLAGALGELSAFRYNESLQK